MIDTSIKKDILIILGPIEEALSKITKQYSIHYKDTAISHLLQSVGFLRDCLNTLKKDIIKESKNGN